MKQCVVKLKSGRDKSVINHHPWVFSGGIQAVIGVPEDGDIVEVQSAVGQRLGDGFYNSKSQIAVRMIAHTPLGGVTTEFWHQRLDQCFEKRSCLRSTTTAYRLVHGESDGLPGLVIDVINDSVVVQLSSVGVEPLREVIQSWIETRLTPRVIIERSDSPSLKAEGMRPRQALWFGEPGGEVTIHENGLTFLVDPIHGQKTGFFIDQRDNRQRIKDLSPRSLLNLFSYTGGFTVAAAVSGARTVSVDTSDAALGMIAKNLLANGLSSENHGTHNMDVFEFLRTHSDAYDCVIVDPPALVKRRADLDKAARAYKDVNRLAIKRVNPGGTMLTCSCSQHLDWVLFRQILFAAGVESGRDVQIVGQFTQPEDHPVSLYFPEGEYLKSFLVRVF